MATSHGWAIFVQQFHLRHSLICSPAAHYGCLSPFVLIGLLRVLRQPLVSRFLAPKSRDAANLLDCLRRLHAKALGADKQNLDLCEVIDGPGGLESFLRTRLDLLAALEREPGVTADDIVAALLAETLEQGADAASVLTEPVGSPTLAGFSEVDALHSAPDLPATSGQGLGGLLALAIGGAGDYPLVMVSAETERYPGQLLDESPSEWGTRAGGVFKEVLRRVQLGITRLDGRLEYSMDLFSPSSLIKMLSLYLRSASGLRETKGRAGLVSVLTRVVYPRLFTSDREVLRTLPKTVQPKIRTHSRWNERIGRLRRDIQEAKQRLGRMSGLLRLEAPTPAQLGRPQHIDLPLNVRVRCWEDAPGPARGPVRLVVTHADGPPVFEGASLSPSRILADITWLGGGRALVVNGGPGAGTAIDGGIVPAGEARILCGGSQLTLGMLPLADPPERGDATSSGLVYQLCAEGDTTPSLPRPPTEAERHTGGGEPSSTDRDGPSGSGDFCAQCSLNGDPRGVRVRDNYKCLGSNSQCERRCNCKDTFAHSNFLCDACDQRFCLAHCAREAHYCAPPPEILSRSRGEEKFPMLATPVAGAGSALAHTEQRESSEEAAYGTERSRREHDVVYWRSWPSLQQDPSAKRPKPLPPAERCPGEGEASGVGRDVPVAVALPPARADDSPGWPKGGATARAPSESSSQDELEIVEEEIGGEEARGAPGGLAAAGAGAYQAPTPRSIPHATPSPSPCEGGAEAVRSSSEDELEITEETTAEALSGHAITGGAARRVPLSHFIPSAPPNPRPRDPPPPETTGSRGPAVRSALRPSAPSPSTTGVVIDLATVRGTGCRGRDPLAALMRCHPRQPGIQRPLSLPERHTGGGEPSSTDKDGPGSSGARASDARYLVGSLRTGLQRPLTPTERHAGGGEPSSTDKDGPGGSETRASGAPSREQTAATGVPDERARKVQAARRRSASQAAAEAFASGPGLTAAQYRPLFCEWARHAPGWIITAMQRWARRGKYRDLTSGTPWHPARPKQYPPPSTEPWTSSLWFGPGRVLGLAERCTAGIPVPAGLALAHACAISAACGQDLISCLQILVTAVQRDNALLGHAARIVERTGGGEPDTTWADVGRTDPRMADWRDEDPGCFLTAQPDGGQEHLTARRRRRRGPGENPAPQTEAPDAMLPWCSPNGLAEECLLGILGGMVGVLDEGHGEGALADLSLLFGYEPTAEVRGIAVASVDILEQFCLHPPSHLGRNPDGYKWAASLPRRGRVPAYLEIASSDVHLSSFLGLNGLVSLSSDEGNRYHEDTLRNVNIRVSTVAVRWANWVVDPENENLKGIHHLLLLAVRYLQFEKLETLDGIELENLITVLHSMYVSTEDTNYRCSQAKRRVTDHMAMWLACGPLADVPVTEKACWATGCATLYRIEAMRRLGHADRARLAVLIIALISRLPKGLRRSELYPTYAVDPAPLLQPPRRGGWDREASAGDHSAPTTSTQGEVAGPLGETGAQNGPTSGTSAKSGVADPPGEPTGGPPGKRQKLGDSREHCHSGERRPMEPSPQGPLDEGRSFLQPGSLSIASRYLNEGRDLVTSGRVWHLQRIAAHLGVPLRGLCWPFLLSLCADQNRPLRCKHWGQRNHETATSAAHLLRLPPGMHFDRHLLSTSQRFSRPATREEKAGLDKTLGLRRSLDKQPSIAVGLSAGAPPTPLPRSRRLHEREHAYRRGLDGFQRLLTPTERHAGGGEPSSTDKDGPGNTGTTTSDERKDETLGQDVILDEDETLRLEMRAAVVTLLVFGKPGDVSPVDDIKPYSMKRARAALRSHGVRFDAWDPPLQKAGAWVAEYVSPPRDPSVVRYVADGPRRRHAFGLIRDRLLRVAGARDTIDSMGNYEVFITFLSDAAGVYLRAVREGQQLFEDNGGDHDDADHSAVLLGPMVPEELVALVPLRSSPATTDELTALFASLPLDERPLLPVDVWELIIGILLSALEPCPVARLSGTCKMLRALLPPPKRRKLQTDHESATALCLKMGLQSSKELREAKKVWLTHRSLTANDLAELATLSLDLPMLDSLMLDELIENHYERPDVVGKFLRLVEGLREGALRSLTMFCIEGVHVGDTGASELVEALSRGAMPKLQGLGLIQAAIRDTTLAILIPVLRQRPALKRLYFDRNPITAEGVKVLVAGLTRLHTLYISGGNSITSDGRDTLVAALASGALPELVRLKADGFGEVAPRLGCGWRVAMSLEDPSLWEITHPPPGGARAPFTLDIPPRWATVPPHVLPSS